LIAADESHRKHDATSTATAVVSNDSDYSGGDSQSAKERGLLSANCCPNLGVPNLKRHHNKTQTLKTYQTRVQPVDWEHKSAQQTKSLEELNESIRRMEENRIRKSDITRIGAFRCTPYKLGVEQPSGLDYKRKSTWKNDEVVEQTGPLKGLETAASLKTAFSKNRETRRDRFDVMSSLRNQHIPVNKPFVPVLPHSSGRHLVKGNDLAHTNGVPIWARNARAGSPIWGGNVRADVSTPNHYARQTPAVMTLDDAYHCPQGEDLMSFEHTVLDTEPLSSMQSQARRAEKAPQRATLASAQVLQCIQQLKDLGYEKGKDLHALAESVQGDLHKAIDFLEEEIKHDYLRRASSCR